MKIAVTGSNGFIGRHVIESLLRQPGVEVVAASRQPPDPSVQSSGIRHVTLDMADPSSGDYDRLGRPDVLIHLAWAGLPNYKSLHHFETELGRQYRFIETLTRAGLPAIVCSGTCLEYGMRSGELDEGSSPGPQTSYGFAKDALRRQLVFLRETRHFNLAWARLFFMYGEGQSPHSLYSQLVAAARRGDRFFRMSGGEQLRDYLSVADVASSLVGLAMRASDAGVVNVCSGRPVTIRSLVAGWVDDNNWEIELDLGHYPYPDYEPMAFWGRNERLKRVLDSQ